MELLGICDADLDQLAVGVLTALFPYSGHDCMPSILYLWVSLLCTVQARLGCTPGRGTS